MNTTRAWCGAAALAVLVSLGACSPATGPQLKDVIEADGVAARIGSDVVFLIMTFTPGTHMQALFQGRVTADADGCLRLDLPDAHTVVWPEGYDFESVDGAIRIVSGSGEPVGTVGEEFALPGGEVTSLHDGLGFTSADRELAEAHCPGRYWIVAAE